MNDEIVLAEKLSLWLRRRADGQDLSAEELCGDRIELLPEIERRLQALRQIDGPATVSLAPTAGLGQATVAVSSTGQGATLSVSPSPAGSTSPSARLLPGYEVEKELGRGGMGVVYQAVDVRLKRRVALKMILAGGHAGQAQLTRFQTEAEAVARLQHPGIVQIHEVGVHDGLPYFALEFCPGGSLDGKLGGTPLPAREAAALVEKLALAMQAAHDKGVIHRDLKPANVLLAEDGTPKVTDFGLARKLDEAGQTQTGAVMGTPSYMAPEQASGSKEIGPACDVYALGAILYECLTGRPPFKAATLMDTIRQVAHDEPIPPTQLHSQTPRDLETIALKCLHKEPGRRYGSAAALAEDLRRFQEGRPIAARPVGQVERGWRWCRRNPALAGALAAVLLVFAVGAVTSTILAVLANRRADEAQQERDNADTERGKTVEALQRADALNDSLLTGVARNDLRTLQSQPGLGGPEVDALWEVASFPDDELRRRFLAVALQTPAGTQQLCARAPFALQAALGLDRRRRRYAEELLGAELGRKGLPQERQLAVAVILSHGPIADRALARRVGEVLAHEQRPAELAAMVASMEPREAFLLLLQGLRRVNQAPAFRQLTSALADTTARMEPKEAGAAAAQTVATLREIMATEAPRMGLRDEVLTALLAAIPRMETRAALAALEQTCRDQPLVTMHLAPNLAPSLSAVVARLGPKEAPPAAAWAADTLTRAISEYSSSQPAPDMVRELVVMIDRMEPNEAVAAAARNVTALTEQMCQPRADRRPYRAQALQAWAAHMGPKDAANVFARAFVALSQSSMNRAGPLEVLSGLRPRLERRQVAAMAARGADSLNRDLAEAARQDQTLRLLPELAWVLQDVLAWMEPKEAAAAASRAAATLTGVMSRHNHLLGWSQAAQAMQSLAPRLGAEDAREAAAVFLEILGNARDPMALMWTAEAARAVMPRLPPKEAAALGTRTAALLCRAFQGKQDNPQRWSPLERPLEALASYLEPGEARKAALHISEALAGNRNELAYLQMVQALANLFAPRLRPEDARQVAAPLLQALDGDDPPMRWKLAQPLALLLPRMEPRQATAAVSPLAARLLRDLKSDAPPRLLVDLNVALHALAPYLKPEQVRQAAATLTQILGKANAVSMAGFLSASVMCLVPYLEPEDAHKVAATLAPILANNSGNPGAFSLANAVLALVARVEEGRGPRGAAEAADCLLAVVSHARQGDWLPMVAQRLTVLLSRMEPGAARTARRAVVEALLRSPEQMARPLADLSQQMEPGEAAELAATFFQLLSTTNEAQWQQKRYLQDSLAVVLDRQSYPGTLTGAVGTAGAGNPLSAAALLSLSGPPRAALPAPVLVRLLKHPLCVGPSRRLVLDQLERHYGRPFTDQWDFVRFAEEQKLDLDLASPPQRSAAAVSK